MYEVLKTVEIKRINRDLKPLGLKVCVGCRKKKEETDFYTHSHGSFPRCKACTKEARLIRYHESRVSSSPRPEDWGFKKTEKEVLDFRREFVKGYELSHNKKRCGRCNIFKDWGFFNKDSQGRHGLCNSCRDCRRQYIKNKLDNEPLFKLRVNLSTRTFIAFKSKSWRKGGSTEAMLGCSYVYAKEYIENQFKDGMTWDNHGEWHIDHVVPLHSANTRDEMIALCHISNLQPLWASENISKGNRYINKGQL